MCKTFEFYADAALAAGERAGLVTVERTLDGQRVIELHEPDLWAARRQREAEQAAERAAQSQRQAAAEKSRVWYAGLVRAGLVQEVAR